jgi:hypothetical protein
MVNIEPPLLKAERFNISRNYPNPFNSATVIEYRLQQDAVVSVNIYDILGRQVETLLAETAQPAGQHSIIWNAGEFPSGIYLYGIRIGESMIIRKCLLLK